MDAILSTLGGALPQLGVGGVLAFVIGLLVKLLMDERTGRTAERAGHVAELDAQSKRHDEELARKGDRLAAENEREAAQHIADMTDLREQLRRAQVRVEELQVTVDIERLARREAEDAAAHALRGHRERP